MENAMKRVGAIVVCFSSIILLTTTSYGEPNVTGQKGLFRVTSAEVPKTGEVALSVHDEFFSQKNLLTSDSKLLKNSVRMAVGYTPLKFLEVSLGTNVESNQLDSNGKSTLAQTSGDLDLNVKGSYDGFLPELTVGGRARVIFYTTFDKIGYELGATSYGIDLLGTYDFTKWASSWPLKATLNIGYLIDNTEALLSDTPDSKPLKSDPPVAHYASDIRGDNVINIGLGFEVPLPEYYITPLLEFTVRYANTYSVYKESGNSNFDKVSFSQNPLILTPGIRVNPPVEGLNVDLGVDIGLSGKIKEDQGGGVTENVSVTPQWTALIAVSYAFTPVVKTTTPAPESQAPQPSP